MNHSIDSLSKARIPKFFGISVLRSKLLQKSFWRLRASVFGDNLAAADKPQSEWSTDARLGYPCDDPPADNRELTVCLRFLISLPFQYGGHLFQTGNCSVLLFTMLQAQQTARHIKVLNSNKVNITMKRSKFWV